ncbi:MAG TPA: cellulase family glycosylhydrolase [Chroococcales cyanobacterium]
MNQALTESNQLVNQYKFNFLRVSGSTNGDGTPNFAAMDQAAAIYSKLGVPVQFEYPITDNQSVFTGSDLTKAESWYSQVAAHFKDNPYVWLATPNESGDGKSNTTQWLAQTTGILGAIHETGNENPVLVDDTNWSGAAIGGNPDSSSLIKYASQLFAADPNLVAAEHDYSADPNHAASNLADGISALKNAGYAPMIQEFGVFNTGNPRSDQPAVDAVLSQATMDQGVGYVGYIDTYGDSAQKETQDAGPGNKDALILPDGSLSAYGKQVVAQNQVVDSYLQSINGA